MYRFGRGLIVLAVHGIVRRLFVNFAYNVVSLKGNQQDERETLTEGCREEAEKDNSSCLSVVLYDPFGVDVEHVFGGYVIKLCFVLLCFCFSSVRIQDYDSVCFTSSKETY